MVATTSATDAVPFQGTLAPVAATRCVAIPAALTIGEWGTHYHDSVRGHFTVGVPPLCDWVQPTGYNSACKPAKAMATRATITMMATVIPRNVAMSWRMALPRLARWGGVTVVTGRRRVAERRWL